MSRFCAALLALCALQLVSAQFPFFGNMFGHHQQQQQQQPSGSQWLAFADGTPCSQYLCPDTLKCVAAPADCPCPSVEDVKCVIEDKQTGEGTVLCTRGGTDCSQAEKLIRKFSP
ncbi:hypothetical protein PENSPDRAFT_589272 [Peniophora sp. CONT]|nr:hypothetical protein PENSPDRAFT_589272 [Peniophora sp. CONT]